MPAILIALHVVVQISLLLAGITYAMRRGRRDEASTPVALPMSAALIVPQRALVAVGLPRV
jgi:hypothetical protein